MARIERRAFTLVELLVVIVIVLLVSAVALPAILSAVNHREVSEAARLLQAQLVQTRDTAIRFDAPRGMRLLPDPTYANSPTILASNRMIPLEPGPEYSNGMVTAWPDPAVFVGGTWSPQPWAYIPPTYPFSASAKVGGPSGAVYPSYPLGHPLNPVVVAGSGGRVLMLEQAPLVGNDTNQSVAAPTSWFWNIRLGDKLKIGKTGATYTVVGPCTVNPFTGGGNPELFVNVGQPGDTSGYITRTYTASGGANPVDFKVEYLLLVNGIDDDGDGYTDEGWDGVDNNDQMNAGAWTKYGYNGVIDDLGDGTNTTTEWEFEKWLGVMGSQIYTATGVLTSYDTTKGPGAGVPQILPPPMPYTIYRRPVPTQAAREVLLPNNVVIDMTSWNSTSERSRLPVDPFSKYVDIMLQPSGQVQPNTAYSSPTSFGMSASFYHFWLSERQDVHEVSDLWGMGATGPNPNPDAGSTPPLTFRLPMPQDAYNAYVASGKTFTTTPSVALTGERMLVTLFARTGQVITNSIEFFDVKNTDTPFLDSQLGQRDGK